MPKARLHATISGRVQGVGFRYFVVKLARQLGVTGWVRNTGDGDVEVLAEGERPQLETLLGYLYQGPFYAEVADVSARWDEGRDEFSDFRVQR